MTTRTQSPSRVHDWDSAQFQQDFNDWIAGTLGTLVLYARHGCPKVDGYIENKGGNPKRPTRARELFRAANCNRLQLDREPNT